jgi:3-hydroxyacyl-CoA dehydrogenase
MKAACYAAGVIGSSWATNFSMQGCEVYVYDLKDSLLEQAKAHIQSNLEHLRDAGCLTQEEADQAAGRIHYTTSVEEAVSGADFIQESGPENLDIKRSIIQTIEQYAPADCPIASSTSGLRVTDIAAGAAHPERLVGAHPFNPPHLIPLVELTKGEQTDEKFVTAAVDFYRKMKKEPIVLKKEKIGFVANRLSHAVLREVINLVNEGVCTPEEADKALVYGPGLRWASVGQIMIGELGSQGGWPEAAVRFKPLNEAIFRDLENRTELPENWGEVATQGAKETMEHMPDCIGHTREEIAQFRDKVLIELLKLHEKL